MYAYVQEEEKRKKKKTMVCEYLKSLETGVPSRVKRMTENPQGLPLYLRRWKYTYTDDIHLLTARSLTKKTRK